MLSGVIHAVLPASCGFTLAFFCCHIKESSIEVGYRFIDCKTAGEKKTSVMYLVLRQRKERFDLVIKCSR